MKMAQCVDGKLRVADGDERAGRALDVEGVADAFEAHFARTRAKFSSRFISVFRKCQQSHQKHLVLLRRGSNKGPSPIVERVRGRWIRSAEGGRRAARCPRRPGAEAETRAEVEARTQALRR